MGQRGRGNCDRSGPGCVNFLRQGALKVLLGGLWVVVFALALTSPASAKKAPPVSTAISLEASSSSAIYGQEQMVHFTAVVTAANGETPSGKGSVLNGGKAVCKLTIKAGVGSCSPKAKALKNGVYSLVAAYKKSSKYAASTSAPLTFAVGVPPETTITSAPSGKVPSGAVEVTFSSNEPWASFECSLDGAPYEPCGSPDRLNVAAGAHHFAVRAVSADGVADPTPATASWESVGQAATLELCGDISANETLSPKAAAVYVITCELRVTPKATLTVAPGTIVKAEDGLFVDVEGALVADGTAAEPITFTSWRDDSLGGDTNGDGEATLPAAGDWWGLYTTPPGGGNASPTLSLEHVNVDYASHAVEAVGATTSVVDSSVSHAAGPGIVANAPDGIPTVKGNTVTYAAGDAIDVISAAVDMGALNGNSGSSNGINGVVLEDDDVAVSSSLPWSGSLIPVLGSGCASLTVSAKVRLTLGAGTVIKGEDCTYLDVEGSLVANGTSANPVTLTSWRDDSAGGDTNDDGDATLPAAGDWGGICTRPPGEGNANPTLSLEHVNVDYATDAVEAADASTAIVDSSVTHSNGAGIVVVAPEGVPTVEDNTVTYAASDAIRIFSAALSMAALNGNSGSHDGTNGVVLGDDRVAVSSSLPWSGSLVPVLASGCTPLTVPAKVTLTLGAGTVIKGEDCTYLDVEGSLVASGTSADPVTLTSWRDDSIGGDTNDDGNATLPGAGDWGGIYTSAPGGGNANPTLSLEHVNVDFASAAVEANEATTSIVDSSVLHSSAAGIVVNYPEGVPTVEGNTVTYAAGDAVEVYSAPLNMAALNGNSGSHDGINGVVLGDDRVAVSSSLPWSGSLVPVLTWGCDGLTVPAKVTLTLGAGTVIKGQDCTYLDVEGSLVANGTSADPVTLTSWRDDSVGGDTNDDGSATLPAAGDWGGIYTSAPGGGNATPTLSFEHVNVDYANRALETNDTSTSILDGAVAHSSGGGISVNEPVGVPTVAGNTVTDVEESAIEIDNASISMAALNGNSGSHDGTNGVVLSDDRVAANSSLPWSGSLIPVLAYGCDSLTVPAKVTLTLEAGTVIKGENCTYLEVEGSLVASGTSADPVTLTSWRDDSVGGDTNDDGSATSPAAGDWGGVELREGGTASLEGTVIKYASTGLAVTDRSFASVRGSFESNNQAVDACGWGQECAVEAPYTYWGSSEGPYPAGDPENVCGAVTATPYRTSASGGATASGPSPYDIECGGGESLESSYESEQASAGLWLGHEEITCDEGFEEACEVIEEYEKCLGAAATLAQSQAPFDFSNGAQGVASDAADWLSNAENDTVRAIGQVASFGLQLVGVAETFEDLASAYRSCI